MKFKTKKILKIIALVLVGGLACGMLLNITDLEDSIFKKDEVKNLISVKDDSYIVSHDTTKGVEIDVDKEDGTIVLKGIATSAYECTVATVTLNAGTYKISGLDKCDTNTFYMSVVSGINTLAYSGVDNGAIDDVFELDAETDVTVKLYWAKDKNFGFIFGTKIMPCIELVEEEMSTDIENDSQQSETTSDAAVANDENSGIADMEITDDVIYVDDNGNVITDGDITDSTDTEEVVES